MITRIGTNACNRVFHSSFCNQTYGATAGFAILTGTAILGLVILNRLYRPAEHVFRTLSTRWVEYHWQRLKGFFEKEGHPLSSSNKLQWREVFKGNTGYIDGIFSSDLTKPVMWGQDDKNRIFVACRIKWWAKNTPEDKKVESYCIFQRYSDADCLVGVGQHVPFEWKNRPNILDSNLAQFLQGDLIEFNEWEWGTEAPISYCCQLDRECDQTTQRSDFRYSLISSNNT